MGKLYVYLAKRVVLSLLSLWLVSIIIFTITQALPGNVANMMLGQFATPENVASVEARLGLNEPLPVQYFSWFSGIIVGDLGVSFIQDRPVAELLIPRFIASLELAGVTITGVIIVGIPLGILSSIYEGRLAGSILNSIVYVGVSIPSFVSGILLITIFAGPVFEVFPAGGYVSLAEGVVPWLRHIMLPALTLMIIMMAHITRQTSSGMSKEFRSDYVRTARLKGLPEMTVIRKHVLRNGLIPVITVLALNFGWLMGSLVVIEEIFAYPGIGRLVVNAVQTRDIPVIQASALSIAAVYMIANLAADIMYTIADPQVDYGDS
jgi:peptide/nickel transport system permease protein